MLPSAGEDVSSRTSVIRIIRSDDGDGMMMYYIRERSNCCCVPSLLFLSSAPLNQRSTPKKVTTTHKCR